MTRRVPDGAGVRPERPAESVPEPGPESGIAAARRVIGWACVALSTLGASFWGFRGVFLNFREGWYLPRLEHNLGLMFAQYLLPAIVTTALALISIVFPSAGAALHLVAGAAAIATARDAANVVVFSVAVPLLLLGFGYAWGRPVPQRRAAALVFAVPFAVIVACSVAPALRVARRRDDGNREARRVRGNGVELVWAPEGPGWPREGVSWAEAVRRCRRLTADGRSLAPLALDLWRLPTVEEAVRSQQRGGSGCGGRWDALQEAASYDRGPDKESPLWDIYSPVIEWWTSSEPAPTAAFSIGYDGAVRRVRKNTRLPELGFRAVRRVEPPAAAGLRE